MKNSWFECNFKKDSGSIVTNSLWKRRQEEKKIELANLLTQQSTSVHPSRVTHWKTVSMESPKLSKLVMPKFGPSQNSRHSVPSAHLQLPPQSVGSSSSTITPAMNRKQIISQVYVQKNLFIQYLRRLQYVVSTCITNYLPLESSFSNFIIIYRSFSMTSMHF